MTEFRFSISGGLSAAERALDLREVAHYDTIRIGRIATVELPAGTVQLDQVSPAGGYGQYTYAAVYRYRLPDGTVLRAGGGGPSDADLLVIETPAAVP